MKQLILPFLYLAMLLTGCSRFEKRTSASYRQIHGFLQKAGITDPAYCYFYENEPRMPLPNVYCFDSIGNPVAAPPQCFAYIKDYIKLLQDSIMPPERNGQLLRDFLDSVPIMNAFDRRLQSEDLRGYDFYLFIDYLAVDQPAFLQTLREAVEGVENSSRKIRLFLVHAFSESNMKKMKNRKVSTGDTAR